MKRLLILYIIAYITIAQARATEGLVKTFSCKSVHNMFDIHYQQGDDHFVDIYINENGNFYIVDTGFNGKPKVLFNDTPYDLKIERTFITAMEDGLNQYVSMAFLGNNNWGLFIKNSQVSTFPSEAELRCKQVDFSVI